MPPFLVPHSLFASMIPKGNYDAEFLGTAAPLRATDQLMRMVAQRGAHSRTFQKKFNSLLTR